MRSIQRGGRHAPPRDNLENLSMKAHEILLGAAVLAVLSVAGSADAAITGKIDSKITLTSACVVNGGNTPDGSSGVTFGTLDFGTQNTLFTQADAQAQTGATAGIVVQCSAGGAPSLSIGAGLYDGSGSGGGNKAMRHAADTSKFVTYSMYADAGRTDLINSGRSFPLLNNGTQQTVNVYGRAFGAAGLIAGNYTDTVVVTLTL
ncbi:MAG: Csu type fimbrial protein [Lysobacter sp.]